MHRHRTSEEMFAAMQHALAAPKVATSDGPRANPLAVMEEVGGNGPLGTLLHAWALVGDVLTFYQERIAEESALSSAREAFSAYAIARGVGHAPRPAVSASTQLAFSVATPPGGGEVTVPAGTAVANIPAEGSLPCIFETSANLLAHNAWNAIEATPDDAPVEPRLPPLATRIVLAGTQALAPGDAIVIRLGTAGAPLDVAAIIADITTDVQRDRTFVRWRVPLAQSSERAVRDVLVLDTRVRLFGALAPPFALAAPSERRKYALGGFVMRDEGAWTRENDGLEAGPLTLAALRDGWCGTTATFFLRQRGVEGWTSIAPAPGVTLQSLAVSPAGRVAVGTTGGDVYVSSDEGDTWLRIGGEPASRTTRRLPSLPVRGIAFDESGEIPNIFVATDRGIAQIALSGEAWTWRNDGFPGTDPKTGYAACAVSSIVLDGATGMMLATTTYGAYASNGRGPWTRIEGLGSIAQIDALSNGRFVACGPGGVFLSADNGRMWTKVIEPDAIPHALAASGTTIAVAAGSDTFTSDDGGETWLRTSDVTSTRITAVAIDRNARVGVASPLLDSALQEWPGLESPLRGTTLCLDRAVTLLPGDVIAVGRDGSDAAYTAYRVRSATTRMLNGYGMAVMGTVVVLDAPLDGDLTVRDALVYVGARSRAALRMRRDAFLPPEQSLPIRRNIPVLPANRAAFVEGRAPQALVGGLAGGSFTLSFAFDGTTNLTEQNVRTSAPDRDAVAVVPLGERGAALARFDGVWQCDDVFADVPAWSALAPLDAPPTSIAVFADKFYAVVGGDVFFSDTSRWRPAGTNGCIRRVLAWNATTRGLLACAQRGAYALDTGDGLWGAAPGLADVEVFAVAAEGNVVVAGTSDGVYRRGPDGGWRQLPGLVRHAVHAVAVDAGTVYAGTAGAGLWRLRQRDWEPVLRPNQTGDIRALALVRHPGRSTPTVVVADAGRGLTIDDTPLAASLTNAIAGFVCSDKAGALVAFRSTPALGTDPATPLRKWIAALDDDRAETELLDAGMMTSGFRDRLAAAVGVKLDAFEIVVEAQGAAWRLSGGDDPTTFLIRREARGRLDVFEVQRLTVRTRPRVHGDPAVHDRMLALELAIGTGPALTLHARESEIWFAPARAAAPPIAEPVTIAHHSQGQVRFHAPLRLAFDPRTVTLLANVADATHGATVALDEPLAILNSSRGQTATLARNPLSYTFPSGAPRPEPVIDVWVRSETQTEAQQQRGSHWRATGRMYEHGPNDRVFTVQHQNDDTVVLTFGDGVHGARVPRGKDNVVARYRFGSGPAGNVAANTLTLMQKLLPYIERVRNPISATGGTAADRLDDLRRDVPIGLVAFDRIVSQRDLTDFVLGFPGVAKVDVRRRRGVGSFAITYACRDGDRVDEAALLAALRANGAHEWSLKIDPAHRRTFAVTAALIVAADDPGNRIDPARLALLNAYGFETRALGADITAASVINLLQSVKGVIAVRLSAVYETGTIARVEERIVAAQDDDIPSLLTIAPGGIVLTQPNAEAAR